MFIKASYILLYMLFNLLLANITILLYFLFLFCLVFNHFFTIPVRIENERLKLALSIPISGVITVTNDVVELILLVTDKTIQDLSTYSKEAIYLLSVLLINSLSLTSATK